MQVQGALNIYTDGSSYNSPRTGGVGIVFVLTDAEGNETTQEVALPGYASATNNQMELQAPILALREAKQRGLVDGFGRIVIHTDSMYVCDNYKKAMWEWPKTHWMKKDGAPVLNAELWKDLLKAMKATGRIVEFNWVKGHRSNPYNKAADKLAKHSAKNATEPALSYISVRKKQTHEKVQQGVVLIAGQRLTIRIITVELLQVQRVWKYRYEVKSKRSPFCGKVDWIYSAYNLVLRDGHTYSVRVNDNQAYPRVLKVFREVEKKT